MCKDLQLIKSMRLTSVLELQSCKETESLVKEITQLKEQVRRLMDNKLNGNPGIRNIINR